MAEASKKEILEHLDSIDLNELLDRMENYVRNRFYDKSEKERNGFDYVDFCYNVLVKATNGIRNWDKEKTSFDKFIFGSLRSDLYNFFRKQKLKKNNKADSDYTEQETYLIELNDFIEIDEIVTKDEPPDIDFEDISKDALKSLREQGANKLEIEVF